MLEFNYENISYFSIHFEEVYLSLNRPGSLGYYEEDFKSPTCKLISNYLNNIKNEVIVYDFSLITRFQVNVENTFLEVIKKYLLDNNKTICLSNLCQNISKNVLVPQLTRMNMKYKQIDNNIFIYSEIIDEEISLSNYIEKMEKAQNHFIIECIKDATVKNHETLNNDNRLTQSMVLLEKYIDIKKLFNEVVKINFFIYQLANNIIKSGIYEYNSKKLCLFCHTHNGMYIASILSGLLHLNYDYLNHIGPIKSIVRNNLAPVTNKIQKFLIISDVICMRTEVNIANAILEFIGHEVIGIAAIVNIVPVLTKDVKNIIEVIEINKENNFINYSIKTDLQGECKCQKSV